MYTHPCTKCGVSYQDQDPEPYFCDKCKEERKAIAQKIDQIIASRPKKNRVSALQEYDNAQKINGFVRVNL